MSDYTESRVTEFGSRINASGQLLELRKDHFGKDQIVRFVDDSAYIEIHAIGVDGKDDNVITLERDVVQSVYHWLGNYLSIADK